MPDPDGLDVTNLKITTRAAPGPSGGAMVKHHVVTYNVGVHGPFEDTYAPGTFTADGVKAAVSKQVQAIRQIVQATKIT